MRAVPVDDFFETYVSELGAQATPQAVPSPVPATNGALNGALSPSPIPGCAENARRPVPLTLCTSAPAPSQQGTWTPCWSTFPTAARTR